MFINKIKSKRKLPSKQSVENFNGMKDLGIDEDCSKQNKTANLCLQIFYKQNKTKQNKTKQQFDSMMSLLGHSQSNTE